MNTHIHNRIILCLSFILVIGEWGCAHHPIPPSSLPESMQQQLNYVGVVVRSTGEQKTIETPRTGRLSNLGRGAGLGLVWGAYGTLCGPGEVVCIPALAGVGVIVGSIAGAVESESESMWRDAESNFRTALADMNFDEILLGDTIAYSREQGYNTYSFLSGAQGRDHTQLAYPASPADPSRALLEMRDPIIGLFPAEFQINPPRRMVLSAQIRLIGSNGEIVLDDRVVTEEFGLPRYLGEWTADSAKLFRDEARLGVRRLAIAITEQAFFQKFPERRFSIDTFSNGYFTGLEPQYPPMVTYLDQADLAPKVSSLQPTLQWEAFKGSNVTYDLMIWRAAGPNLGNLIYSRGHLLEPIHTLEITLDADAHYFWTVRARFTVDGKTKVTEWSRRSFSPSLLAYIISLGLVGLGHLADVTSGFYQFRTSQ